MTIPFYDAETIRKVLTLDKAMDALEQSLKGAVDPESDGPRLFADAPDGEFLLMPAQAAAYSGVKALTIAPKNPDRGLEKIQGIYILYSSDTLAPVALMEGASLTAIRTPAVTVSAVRQLAAAAEGTADAVPERPRILVFGAGVQAPGHIRAAQIAFPGARFDVVGRRPERVAALQEELRNGSPAADITDRTGQIAAAVSEADIIMCLTSTSTALFDGRDVSPGTIIAAVGTHGLDVRELDDEIIARSDLVVEGRGSAQRENGNLVSLTPEQWNPGPPNLADLAQGKVFRTPGRPVVYTGVGMSWEDLVCASAIHEALS